MRKQLLGVVLPLVILVMMTAAAQTQNTGTSATEHAALQRLIRRTRAPAQLHTLPYSS